MPDHDWDEEFFSRLFRETHKVPEAESQEVAPSRLKARVYSALIREQQQTGPLKTLTESEEAGHGLCMWEKLVQIAPIGEEAKSPFFCWTCHARFLAEHMEKAPIYWANCPYADFQKQ